MTFVSLASIYASVLIRTVFRLYIYFTLYQQRNAYLYSSESPAGRQHSNKHSLYAFQLDALCDYELLIHAIAVAH